MKRREKRFLSHIVELLVVVSFVSFAAGYMLTGGARQVEQFAYGENMAVNVRIPELGIDQQVQLYKGMTPFDALLRVASMKTEFYHVGSIVTELGGKEQWWGYRVNGIMPLVGMQDYQLRDGDNLELFKLEW